MKKDFYTIANRIKNGEKFKIDWNIPNKEPIEGIKASEDGWTVQSWNEENGCWESISIIYVDILFE